jgi:hypothetical protein
VRCGAARTVLTAGTVAAGAAGAAIVAGIPSVAAVASQAGHRGAVLAIGRAAGVAVGAAVFLG